VAWVGSQAAASADTPGNRWCDKHRRCCRTTPSPATHAPRSCSAVTPGRTPHSPRNSETRVSQVEAGRARLGDRLRFIKAQAGQLALFLPTRNHVGPSGRTPSCTRTKTATAGCCCQLACGANARLNRTTVGSGHTTSALGRAASSNSAAAAASALPGRFSMRVPAAARVRWETR